MILDTGYPVPLLCRDDRHSFAFAGDALLGRGYARAPEGTRATVVV